MNPREIQEELYVTDTQKRKSLYDHAPLNFCERCDGCKQIANDDEGTPWWHWAQLPPPSNMAVVMGMVRPLPCAKCGGTGVDPEKVSA